MAIAFVATGTVAKVGSGSMSPGLPSGWAANDIHLLLAVCQNGESVAASGYTAIFDVNNNDGGNNTQIGLLWRRAVGGDAGPTVTGATSGSMCAVSGFSGCETSGNPYRASPTSNAPAIDTTITWTGLTPGSSSDMVAIFAGSECQFGSPTVSGYSGTDPTFTEGLDDANSIGASWTGLCMAYGLTTDAAATGNRTATSTESAIYGAFMLSLIPVAAGVLASDPIDPAMVAFG